VCSRPLPAPSPAARRDLARLIEREGLEVQTIGAVHARNGTLDEFRHALAVQTRAP
jgi:hypothetical protein